MTRLFVLPLVLSALAQPVLAGTVYQLTQAEVDSVVAAPVTMVDSPGTPLVQAPTRDRRVHGEIGTEFGNHGTRSIFGTAMVPLGENGFAAFSFEDGSYGRARFRR